MVAATWALFGVTFLLAVFAAWYACETRRLVNRMDLEREQLSRPVLTFQLIPLDAQSLKLRIQNTGNGPALAVKGTIEAVRKSESISKPWSYPLLAPGKYEEFGFPRPPGADHTEGFALAAIRSDVIEVRARFAYKSASGSEYKLDDSIQIQGVTDDWIASGMMATQDHPDRILPRIAKALEDIAGRR